MKLYIAPRRDGLCEPSTHPGCRRECDTRRNRVGTRDWEQRGGWCRLACRGQVEDARPPARHRRDRVSASRRQRAGPAARVSLDLRETAGNRVHGTRHRTNREQVCRCGRVGVHPEEPRAGGRAVARDCREALCLRRSQGCRRWVTRTESAEYRPGGRRGAGWYHSLRPLPAGQPPRLCQSGLRRPDRLRHRGGAGAQLPAAAGP